MKNSDDYMTRAEFEEHTFYQENPHLNDYKEVLSSVAKDKGVSLQDVVKDDAVKNLIEKAGKYDQSESVKSVLESNPQLKASADDFTNAREALKAGNSVKANEAATKAVLAAFAKKD